MPAFSRRLAVAFGTVAVLSGAPAAFAQNDAKPSTNGSAAQTPGPQNPGGRMPESGRIPNSPGAQAQQGTHSDPGTPSPKGSQGDTSPGAKLTTH